VSGLIRPYRGKLPSVGRGAFIAETAVVIGDSVIGAAANLWYGVVVRGDVNFIRIGARTNIQDNAVVHVSTGTFPTIIGDDVTIGHMALVHACTIEDRCLIGMQSCILDGAVVERGAIVAAGALVPPGKRVKAGELWAGVPARMIRAVTEDETRAIALSAERYCALAAEYLKA
jgi:gamma-carbonic anhydrase